MLQCWNDKRRWSANYDRKIQVAQVQGKRIPPQEYHKIKIKLSLTRTRTKTLNYAHKITEENKQNINFAFSDPNGNLKFRLGRPVNGNQLYPSKPSMILKN